MGKPFFITTAIDYTNGAPHIGHAYEKVLADVLARYHRLKGEEVFFLTGVDQHGQKVQQSAEKAGIEPQQFVDQVTAKFVALWKKLEVEYSDWAATTDAKHKECVRANLQMLWDDKVPGTDRSRWIYKKTQRGFYSVRQEQFLTDKERGPDGEFGPEWQPVEEREEENFYFRLTEHPDLGFDPKQWLLDLIEKRSRENRPLVVPDFRVAELRNAVEKLEGDLCISRPASRLKWGIPFPESFGAGFVTYVWFDALVNYITWAPGHDPGYSHRSGPERAPGLSFQDWWPPLHVIGKDILIPAHGVYWPIMLKAMGFSDEEMPTLLVHGWWNIRGKGGESEKMSKSLGNVVDPDILADKYGAEAVRYYLMSDIATGKDADFSEERLVQSYNAALANSLGNLLNRTLNMAAKYREGALLKPTGNPVIAFGMAPDGLSTLIRGVENAVASVADESGCDVPYQITFSVGSIASNSNGLVEVAAPWTLAKKEKAGDAQARAELDAVLYHLAESLRIIAILISPVLPGAAHGIFDQLNWKMDLSPGGARSVVPPSGSNAGADEMGHDRACPSNRFRLADAVWGGLPDGHVLGKPVPLFPRIEPPKE
jgi:methionyl-tRNA synthetase